MAEDKLFDLEIISPDRVFYRGRVKMAEMNTSDGQLGIYRDHIPLTTILEPGIVTITEESVKKKAAVHTGFVEILKDKVKILAEIAEWPEEIDLNRATEAKIRAQRRMEARSSEVNLVRADLALRKAIVRIEAAKK